MRFFTAIVLSGAALVASVVAEPMLMERHVQVLDKRQSFTPTTQTGSGATCADAFGAGYEICAAATASTNQLCYNPSSGQTCCSTSWACPSGSFCYTNGNCCPNGLTQAECAAQLSAAATATATANPSVVPSSTVVASATPAVQGNGTVTASSTAPAVYTGAANSMNAQLSVAALGGLAAFFGAML